MNRVIFQIDMAHTDLRKTCLLYVIVVTHALVSCVTTDLLHSLCIPFRVHITPFIGQLVSTTCGGCGMHQTHENVFCLPLNLFNSVIV